MSKRILLLAPHDDDIVLSFGGLIYDELSKGSEIWCHVFTCGGPCSNVSHKIRYQEFVKVMEFYGIDSKHYQIGDTYEYQDRYKGTIRYFGSDLDGRLDTLPNCFITGYIDSLVTKIKPTDVYCTADSNHADHHALYKAFMASIRLKTGWMPQNIFLGEYQFLPSTYVQNVGGKVYLPLTETAFKKKCDAFSLEKSQFKPSPSPLGIDGIKILAMTRGMEIGEKYAEMYYQVKSIRYDYFKD